MPNFFETLSQVVRLLHKNGSAGRLDKDIETLEKAGELESFFFKLNAIDVAGPSSGFTSGVMNRLPAQQAGFLAKLYKYVRSELRFVLHPEHILSGRISREDCALYLFLAAFAHIPIALAMTLGFKSLNMGVSNLVWLEKQPFLLLSLAVLLFLTGFYAWRGGRAGLRAAVAGVLVYLWLVTFNSVFSVLNIGVSAFFAPLFFQLIVGVFLSAFLLAALKANMDVSDGLRPAEAN